MAAPLLQTLLLLLLLLPLLLLLSCMRRCLRCAAPHACMHMHYRADRYSCWLMDVSPRFGTTDLGL